MFPSGLKFFTEASKIWMPLVTVLRKGFTSSMASNLVAGITGLFFEKLTGEGESEKSGTV